jgi:hypothetical protein
VVEQRADGGRLAGAIRPEEAERLALADSEVDLDDAAVLAVGLGEPFRLDDGRAGGNRVAGGPAVLSVLSTGGAPRAAS